MLNMKCIYCGEETGSDMGYVCSECLERDFTSCSDCGVWVHHDDICTVIRNREGYEVHVCERCRDTYYRECAKNNSK